MQLAFIRDFLPATREQAEQVHSPAYVQWLHDTVREGVPKVVADPEVADEVTYVTSSSCTDALKVRRCLDEQQLKANCRLAALQHNLRAVTGMHLGSMHSTDCILHQGQGAA